MSHAGLKKGRGIAFAKAIEDILGDVGSETTCQEYKGLVILLSSYDKSGLDLREALYIS